MFFISGLLVLFAFLATRRFFLVIIGIVLLIVALHLFVLNIHYCSRKWVVPFENMATRLSADTTNPYLFEVKKGPDLDWVHRLGLNTSYKCSIEWMPKYANQDVEVARVTAIPVAQVVSPQELMSA